MRMEEEHEHGRTTCAYRGVNGVTFRFIAQSSASGSPSKLSDLVSSSIDSFFPSFRIHSIVVINHHQSISIISIVSNRRLSRSVPHPHMSIPSAYEYPIRI